MSQSKKPLKFEAKNSGEKIAKTITLTNSTPETILEGHWEVLPNPNDNDPNKPHHSQTKHLWISFSHQKFQGKKVEEGKEDSVECKIIIDTKNLAPAQTFKRTIRLKLNTEQQFRDFPIEVKTAAWNGIQVPYKEFIILSLCLTVIAFIATTNVSTVLNGVSKVTPQMGIEKVDQDAGILFKSSLDSMNDFNQSLINSVEYSGGIIFVPICLVLIAISAILAYVLAYRTSKDLMLPLFAVFTALSIWLTKSIYGQIESIALSIKERRRSLDKSFEELMLLLKNADKNTDKFQEIALKEYWDKANFNIGVTVSISLFLVVCINYYLIWFLKDKIQSLLIRISLLIVISCFSISLGTSFAIGFDKWFTLPLLIASGSCLATLNIRHNLKCKKYIQNHSDLRQS